MLVTVRDISERATAQEALRRSEERYRRFFESTPAGTCISRPDGAIVAFNEEFARLFGIAGDAAGPVPSASSLYADPTDRVAILGEIDRAGRIAGREVLLRRTDGSTFTGALYGAAVRDPDGRLSEIQSHVLDVSSARAMEAQLRQSQKLEALGLLAGCVAHDFNNLLTAISGYTDLILRSFECGDRRREWCVEVMQTTDRAAGLTQQLLAFSRRQVVQPRPICIGDVVTAMTRMLERIVGEEVAVRVHVEPGARTVFADRNQIEQILLNLCVNARDAMPGGGHLDIRVRPVERPGSADAWVELSVADDGTGMSRKTLERMFEPFFTTKPHGTGLGLSTVYGIVQQAGGEVLAESEVGRGTTFRILLPGCGASADPGQTPDSGAGTAADGGGRLVLLVEDEAPVRRLLRGVLEASGYAVAEAGDGAQAIEAMDAGLVPDVVVTDVVMPVLGGRQLADAVRARHARVPVVFMSGYARDEALREELAGSPGAFLQKPFAPGQLVARVAEVLRGGVIRPDP